MDEAVDRAVEFLVAAAGIGSVVAADNTVVAAVVVAGGAAVPTDCFSGCRQSC